MASGGGKLKAALAATLLLGVADLGAINFYLAPRYAEERAARAGGSVEPRKVEPSKKSDLPPKRTLASRADLGPPRAAPDVRPRAERPDAAPVKPPPKTVEPVKPPPRSPPKLLPPKLPVIHFGTASSSLGARARSQLRLLARELEKRPKLRLLLRGHADERGGADFNKRLGKRRAGAVARFLTRSGVARGRLRVESAGSSMPADRRNTPAAWARNRRVQFVVEGS